MCCSSLEYCLIGLSTNAILAIIPVSRALDEDTGANQNQETKTGDNLTKARTASIRAKKSTRNRARTGQDKN
jgi:hypothetical protein